MNSLGQLVSKAIGWVLIGGLVVLILVIFSTQAQLSTPKDSISLTANTVTAVATDISTTQTPIATATATVDGTTPTPTPTATGTVGNATQTATVTATSTPMPTPTASLTASPTVAPPDITPLPTPTMVATPDISDWVVYDNSEHGFRLYYPPTFTYVSGEPSETEILREMAFYDPSEYEPGDTTFNAVGLAVIANREQFDSVEAWAAAHVIGVPGIGERDLQFVSYQILSSFPVNGQEATLLTTQSVWGGTEYYIMIPLSDFNKFALFFYYENINEIGPVALSIVSTLEEID